ncbi:hypothetical protein QG37_02480 [Candidozyma auris]|uniref:Uncharacterized protein n=1 Tax=Candidozyma auris TaxID=498019 RepID=A0A0L0P2F7_CANAR|nr:hypothetical protein QG37_02480 [[Candida] auris]
MSALQLVVAVSEADLSLRMSMLSKYKNDINLENNASTKTAANVMGLMIKNINHSSIRVRID